MCAPCSFKGSIARRLFFPEGNHCKPKSTRLIKMVSPLPHKKKKKRNLLLEIALHPLDLILKLTSHIVETSALRCEIFIYSFLPSA